jgi:hypothetical protein
MGEVIQLEVTLLAHKGVVHNVIPIAKKHGLHRLLLDAQRFPIRVLVLVLHENLLLEGQATLLQPLEVGKVGGEGFERKRLLRSESFHLCVQAVDVAPEAGVLEEPIALPIEQPQRDGVLKVTLLSAEGVDLVLAGAAGPDPPHLALAPLLPCLAELCRGAVAGGHAHAGCGGVVESECELRHKVNCASGPSCLQQADLRDAPENNANGLQVAFGQLEKWLCWLEVGFGWFGLTFEKVKVPLYLQAAQRYRENQNADLQTPHGSSRALGHPSAMWHLLVGHVMVKQGNCLCAIMV